MGTQQEVTGMNIEALATLATEIAAKHAFKHQSNQGTPDAFTFQVTVRIGSDDRTLYLHAVHNAQVSENRAEKELRKVDEELVAAIALAGVRATRVKTRGFATWRTYWGRHSDGFSRGVRLVG